MNTGVSAKAGRREAVSTSGWRQGVRKRDSLSEENKGDPIPCCFSEGLPTPPKAVTAMGWKLVSDGGVKAQLALELILSCSFCFPSRPCGDTAGSSLRSRHLCHSSSSSTGRCLLPLSSPLVLLHGHPYFPKHEPVDQPRAEERQEPVLASSPLSRCGRAGV